MLPKVNRLPSSQIFSVMRYGQRYHAPYVSLACKRNMSGTPRFAFVVPLSVNKKSVVRNKLKRIMRDVVHSQITNLAMGWDVVCTANKNAVSDGSRLLAESQSRLLSRAGIIKK